VSWGLLNLLMGVVPGGSVASGTTVLAAFVALPFLMGVAQAPLCPTTGANICNWFPVAGWAWPNALTNVGLTFAAAATSPDPVRTVVFLSVCLGFQQSTEGPFWAATIAAGGRHCATACGVLNTGGNIVGGIGALLVPLTVEYFGWTVTFVTASVFAFLAAALVWPVRIDVAPAPEGA
jgi:sugar phosphate permease